MAKAGSPAPARRAASPAARRPLRRRRALAAAGPPPVASPDRLCRALAKRAPRMGTHHRTVAALAATVAEHIGLGDEQLRVVIRAAEVHDVGKVLLPDAILNKPAALTPAELALMRRHAVDGERILAAAAEPAPIPALVRASHERWDGSGYPDGLRGEAIPLGARILTICDAYDAMTHARPYRPARSAPEAAEELRLGAGTRYDPRLVDVFLRAALPGAYSLTRVIQ